MSVMKVSNFNWNQFPQELLILIYKYLPAKDLSNAMCVNKFWNYVGQYDKLWKILFEKEFFWFYSIPKVFGNFREELIYFKRDLPVKLQFSIEHYGYNWQIPIFSNTGKYLIVSGEPASFSIYSTKSFDLLDERCLASSLNWNSIGSMYFSPDDCNILINGIRNDNTGEIAVFSIDPESFEIHFVCRVLSFPKDFYGCWFDKEHIIVGEYYEFGFQSPIATSISQIYLCSLPKTKSESSNFYPFLRFLNQKSSVVSPLITNAVSSRFRRVIQIGHQARSEGKSLSEKLEELELQSEIGSNIKELREVLDRDQQCFRCYLKHQLTEEEYGGNTECNCCCHQIFHKMLIYVTGEFRERICFKLLDNELVNDSLNFRRFKPTDSTENENKEDEQPEDRWEYIMSRVDQPDHHIDFGGSVDHIWLTPNQKILFVSLETISRNENNEPDGICHEVRVIDLDKMIVDPIGCRGSVKPQGQGRVSCGSRLAVSYSKNDINIWSVHHIGLPVEKLHIDTPISSVAVHPTENYLAVTCGFELRIYK